jgi:transcriptional regulator
MYVPEAFAERRVEVLHGLIDEHPLGALVVLGPDGLNADHLPFELVVTPAHTNGLLRAHVARANPLARRDGAVVMAVFQTASAYVSPTLYDLPAVGGQAVPTWNYAVVHAHGRLRVVDEPAWILAHMRSATERREAGRKAIRGKAWSVDDAPRDFIERLLGATVGIEVAIERLEGKFKLSQNRSAADRERVRMGTQGNAG